MITEQGMAYTNCTAILRTSHGQLGHEHVLTASTNPPDDGGMVVGTALGFEETVNGSLVVVEVAYSQVGDEKPEVTFERELLVLSEGSQWTLRIRSKDEKVGYNELDFYRP